MSVLTSEAMLVVGLLLTVYATVTKKSTPKVIILVLGFSLVAVGAVAVGYYMGISIP